MARLQVVCGLIARRLLALVLGFLLAFVLLEFALQLSANFVRGDRAGEGDGSCFALCVGDSNTFGLNVPKELAYPAQLERLLRDRGASPARVVNRGVPGKPTWIVDAELATDLDRFRPRVLLILCGVNDRNLIRPEDRLDDWLARSRAVNLLRRTWKNTQEHFEAHAVEPRNRMAASAVESVAPALSRLRFADRQNEDRSFLMHFGNPSKEQVALWIREDLAHIATRARAAGALPIVCLYFEDNNTFAPINAALGESARDLGLLLFDPRPAFARALARVDRSHLVFPDCHLKPPGYAILARLLVNFAVEAGVLAGPSIEDVFEPLNGIPARAPRVSPWIEGGVTKGVEVSYLPGLKAQLLLSSHDGLTHVRFQGTVIISLQNESSAQLPIDADESFRAALARSQAFTVVLGDDGTARIPIPSELLAHERVFAMVAFIDDEPEITAVSQRLALR
ncbi:MAG: GDSL-type esterase/lipase family protein [Planctomycetes bacterium]|nr:GDSL-type esterase/lipase family protein [Planctomycetota bacterium]